MSTIPWIMITIGVLIILLGIVAIYVYRTKGKKHKTDYYTFFIMGIIWTIFGIIFYEEMSFFLIMGIAFMIIGLANKDKWEKNHKTWKQSSKSEKKLKIIIMALGIVLLVGIIVFFLVEKGVIK